MNDINHRISQILILLSASFPVMATESVSASALEPAGASPAAGQKYNRTFPIWAQEAIDLGHELPKPYGFSIGYMKMDQPLIIDSVGFSGLGPADKLVSVEGSEAHQDSETLTLRGDFWLLPFLTFTASSIIPRAVAMPMCSLYFWGRLTRLILIWISRALPMVSAVP